MEFKVGEKVRIKNNLREIENFKGGFVYDMEEYEGKIVTIMDRDYDRVHIKEDSHFYVWDIRAFEKIIMTRDDIKEGDIITLRNGDRLLVDADKDLQDLSEENDNSVASLYVYRDDMIHCCGNKDYDIVKVERPVKYSTIFEREEVKEMTVEEISKALGYEVKVVK